MNKNISFHDRSQGFTLLEILLAILIFSLVITTVYASFSSFVGTSTVVRQKIKEAGEIQQALGIIHDDLRTLWITTPPRYRPENEEDDPFIFKSEEINTQGISTARLMFSSFNHLSLAGRNQTGPVRIIYCVKQGRDGGLDLCRIDSPRPFPDWEEIVCAPAILKNITSFDLIYTDLHGETFRSWNSDSDQFQYALPASVQICLSMTGEGGKRTLRTAVTIPLQREINSDE